MIAGFVYWDGRPARHEVLAVMCRAASPNHADLTMYVSGSAALASREGGSSALLGRVYNMPELLARYGTPVPDESAARLVARLARSGGTDFLRQVNGMFACAIIEPGRVLLARDRFGQQMMVYALLPYGIVFGTDINAVAQHPDVDLTLDPVALDDLLGLGYIPAPKTIYWGIRKIKPGMALVVENDQVSAQLYWDITRVPPVDVDEHAAIEHTAALLREAVARCWPATTSAGVFLSSGLDSNIVAALASARGRLKTFTVSFNGYWRDESAHAAQAAAVYGSEHHSVPVDYASVRDLPDLLVHYGEPFADSSHLPAYLVAQAAAAQVDVVLSGDGGDGLFAPPTMWRKSKYFASHPADARRRTYTRAWWSHLTSAPPRETLLAPGDGADGDQLHYIQRWSFFDDSVLFKVSRTSARTGLEIRAPLLDGPFVDWAASLPPEYAVRGDTLKWVLREAFADLLPPFILALPKRGFGAPIFEWMPQLLAEYGYVLGDDTQRTRGIFDPKRLARLVAGYHSGDTHPHTLYPYLVFELWLRATESRRGTP